MSEDLKRRLIEALPRDLLIDLLDMAAARALAAFELIRDHTDLGGKRARGAEGQVRFRIMEKGFEDVCARNGGIALDEGVIPGTDLKFFQPFMRFNGPDADHGVILGLASMPSRGELPVKNQSRASGVTLNYSYSRSLFDEPATSPQPGDVFVLFLVARDPARAGHIKEVAIGVIDAEYKGYVSYQSVEEFMAEYVTDPGSGADQTASPIELPTLVKLKPSVKPFKAPEADPEEEADKEEGSGRA